MDFAELTKQAGELINKGGVTMLPLIILSVITLTIAIERGWFWTRLFLNQNRILDRILDAANRNWDLAEKIARESRRYPIGNFLYAPLKLSNPDPELFHFALESAANDEVALMRKGDKMLELIIALSPLLGLFGTVWGLIQSLTSIQISDLGTSSTAGVTLGIGEALISTAGGLFVAIVSLVIYRLFQLFTSNQIRIFRKVGTDLELIYRQRWMEPEEIYSDRPKYHQIAES